MRATVFHGVNDIHVEEVARPRAGVGEAVIRVALKTLISMCCLYSCSATNSQAHQRTYQIRYDLLALNETISRVIEEQGKTVENRVQLTRCSVPLQSNNSEKEYLYEHK